MTTPTLTRVLKPGVYGKDVQAIRRVGHHLLGRAMPTADLTVQRAFNPSMTRLVKDMQDELVIEKNGWVGPATMVKLREADRACGGCLFRAYELQLLQQAAVELKPKLIEPNQGWESLHPSLWKAYSLGRTRYGLSDLGTYNPASTLPGGGPSDHSVFPAFAFDLGIEPDTGWQNLKARAFVLQIAGWPEVEYVILGDRIYTGRLTWHRYTAGGHLNHVHVSGRR